MPQITLQSLAEEIVKHDNYQKLREALITSRLEGGLGITATQATKDKIATAVKARAEYETLWAKQKEEVDAREKLQELITQDNALKELITQKGLETNIDQEVKVRLASSRAELQKEINKYGGDQRVSAENARLLANMGYAYILMAQHFKVARAHVMAIVAKDTKIQKVGKGLKTVTVGALKVALNATLGVLSGGIAAVLITKYLDTLLFNTGGTGKESMELAAKRKEASGKRRWDQDEHIVESTVSKTAQAKTAGALDKLGKKAVMTPATKVAKMITSNPGAIKDPYDFFLEKEVELRKVAAYVASITNEADLEQVELGLDHAMSFTALKADPYWGWFKDKHNAVELNERWGEVSRLLSVYMRRLCWRLHCRSQWQNTTYDYTLKANSRWVSEDEESPATEWPYKAWEETRGVWPAHWDKICSDFQGPEHDPNDTFTVSRGMVSRAWKLQNNVAWISMAAVQCCQIERFGGWHIDLEKLSHFGGKEGEAVQVPTGKTGGRILTDREIVFGGTNLVPEEFLRKIRVKGGIMVKIVEIRVGKGEKWKDWRKPTGKKGRLTTPNDSRSALPIPKNLRITVMISRTDSKGQKVRSSGAARVRVYKVQLDPDKKAKDHADGTWCDNNASKDDTQKCWYCRNTADAAQETIKDKYRLKEVDKANNWSIKWKGEGGNYLNFPHNEEDGWFSATNTWPHEPGLYCIRMDPKTEWMEDKTIGLALQQHVSDEWWFRILDQEDTNVSKPIVDWPQRVGAESIKGRCAEPPGTLIHVFVDDKLVGKTEVTDEAGNWVLRKVAPLKAGQLVTAKATRPASVGSSAQQSGALAGTAVQLSAPTLEPLEPGDDRISGRTVDGAGITIVIAIRRLWDRLEAITGSDGAWEAALPQGDVLKRLDEVTVHARKNAVESEKVEHVVFHPSPKVVIGEIDDWIITGDYAGYHETAVFVVAYINGTEEGSGGTVDGAGEWEIEWTENEPGPEDQVKVEAYTKVDGRRVTLSTAWEELEW